MKVWLKVLVSVGLLTLLLVLLPWEEVRGAVLRLPPSAWLLVLAGFVAGHALGIVKWRVFVNAGHAMLQPRDAIQCYSAGLFANLCLPSIVGGDLLRAAMAAKFTRRPEAAFLGGVIDRITDMVAMVILVVLGGIFSRAAIPGWGAQAVGVALVLGALVTVIGAPLILRLPLARWPRRLRRPVGRSLVALRRLARNPRAAVTALTLSLTIQGGFVMLNRLLGQGIGIEVPLAVWFLVWPLAKVAALMPISLGGLAVREATLGALLAPFGVPFAVGVVCSLLWQTVLIAGGLLGGVVWLVLARIRNGGTTRPMAVIHQATQARHG